MTLGLVLSFIAIAACIATATIIAHTTGEMMIVRCCRIGEDRTKEARKLLTLGLWGDAILVVVSLMMTCQILGFFGTSVTGGRMPEELHELWKITSVASLVPLMFALVLRLESRRFTQEP